MGSRSLRIRRRRLLSQLEKKIEVGGDTDYDDHESAEVEVCHDFLNQATADVLWEIFIRLPDCRSAVRSSAVCRSWHSLILDNPKFIPSFKSQHQQPLIPYTILLTYHQHMFQIFYQEMFYDEYMFPHEKSSSGGNIVNLDFLPKRMAIRASCNDLLLLSPGSPWTNDPYVCNPITKQFVHLPASPRLPDYPDGVVGYGLLCSKTNNNNNNNPFKVVEVIIRPFSRSTPNDEITVPVTIFCSESRKWESRSFSCLGPTSVRLRFTSKWDVVTCNGVMYWLDELVQLLGSVFYLDLSRERCGFIELPSPRHSSEKHRLGAVHVKGGEVELRLIQASGGECLTGCVNLTVWRLNINDSNYWELVHGKCLKRPTILGRANQFSISPFVHPTNGDLAFVVWGPKVFECNLVDATCKPIYDLPRQVQDGRRLTPVPLFLPYPASNIESARACS